MKFFMEPAVEVEKFAIEDVITTSNDSWGGGGFEIAEISTPAAPEVVE